MPNRSIFTVHSGEKSSALHNRDDSWHMICMRFMGNKQANGYKSSSQCRVYQYIAVMVLVILISTEVIQVYSRQSITRMVQTICS
jgi:hypothetical protein